SNTVTRSDARIRAISTVRTKPSRECGNYATRPKIQSSTILSSILIYKCKPLRLGWQQPKGKRTKRLRCYVTPLMRKTFWANIPFRPAHLFRFANNSAVSCSSWVNRRKRNGNLKLRSRSIRDASEDYMERRGLPSKTATRKAQAVTTRSWRHKRQRPLAHEMN